MIFEVAIAFSAVQYDPSHLSCSFCMPLLTSVQPQLRLLRLKKVRSESLLWAEMCGRAFEGALRVCLPLHCEAHVTQVPLNGQLGQSHFTTKTDFLSHVFPPFIV